MTTTQPAALPELPPLTGDILIEDRTIYVLNKNGENVWWATVYPGFHDNGIRVSDDQCRDVAADLARLAALQPQPAAAVSDEEIWGLWDSQERSVAGWACPVKFARATLALRPQAVPMTDEQIDAMTASIFGAGTLDVEEIHAVREVVRTVEAHHGITAQGAQGGEG